MALFRETGALMLGTRLRRLSDKFFVEISKIYKSEGIEFEASWFPVFFLLERNTSISITDIANELEISQSAVSQMVVQLEKRGFLCIRQEKPDRRVRLISLTEEGRALLKRVHPVWEAISHAVANLISNGKASCLLLEMLNEFETEMEEESLSELVRKELHSKERI